MVAVAFGSGATRCLSALSRHVLTYKHIHGSTQQQISSNRSGYALGVRGLRRLTLSESPVPVFGINHDMKSLFSMRTWTSEPSCRPSKKDGRPSAPSDASRGVSEISPRAGRGFMSRTHRLQWSKPAPIETRWGGRKSSSAEITAASGGGIAISFVDRMFLL